MRTLTILILAGFLHASVIIANAEPELKGTPAELEQYLNSLPGKITLTATAEVKAEANRAVMQLRIVTKEKLLQQALDKNRKIRDDIVRALTAHGLDKDGIRIAKFSSTSTTGWFSKRPGAYEINSSVEIHAANENDEHAVAELIDSLPEVTLESLHFEHTEKERLQQQATSEALDKINTQKKLYEEKLGVTLRSRSVYATAPVPDSNRKAAPAFSTALNASIASGGEEVQNLDLSQFDEVTYRAQVNVVFDIITRESTK